MKKFLSGGLLLAGLLSSCVSPDPRTWPGSPLNNDYTPDRLAPVVKFHGFQFDRPATDRWVLYPRESTRSSMVLHQTGQQPPYTAFVFCQLMKIPSGAASLDDFEKLVQKRVTHTANPQRFKVLSVKTETSLRQNQWCVSYVLEVLDSKPANSSTPLVTRYDGFYVLHPSEKLLVLNAGFSQRGNPETLLAALDADVRALLDSVVLLDKAGNRIE